jgi:hypothetical protein
MAGVPTGSDVTGFSGFDGDVEDLAEMDEETREMALLGFDVGLDDDDDRPSRRKRERTPDGHLGRRAGLASPFNKKS